MNIKKIKELIELMNDNNITEVEIEQEGTKIKLSKNNNSIVEQVSVPSYVAQKNINNVVEEKKETIEKDDNVKEIKSPMIGTFYRASSPEAEPYVKEGDVIKKGDVLCIVEAMKVMNEVKADFGGEILEINVDNAEAVEYGQVMFKIKIK